MRGCGRIAGRWRSRRDGMTEDMDVTVVLAYTGGEWEIEEQGRIFEMKRLAFALAVVMAGAVCLSGCAGVDETEDGSTDGEISVSANMGDGEETNDTGDADMDGGEKTNDTGDADMGVGEETNDKEDDDMGGLAKAEDISSIAFYVNSGTSTEWVYYDLEAGCRYRDDDSYPFSELTDEKRQDCEYGDELVSELESAGVFEWESVSDSEGIDDAQSMKLEVTYADGTTFVVTADGILYEIMPDAYAEVESLLLDGMGE